MAIAISDSPWKKALLFAGAAILPHIPCIIVATGLFSLGATAASLFTNPWMIGSGVLLSLSSISLTRHFLCRWRCEPQGCANAAPEAIVRVQTKGLRQTRKDMQSVRQSSLRRGAAISVGYVAVAAASAVTLPRFLPNMHCHISSIDYNRSVLLSCPNSTGSILVTISNQNQVVFIDGASVGARKMEICNGPSEMWMPRCQPGGNISTMTAVDAGGKFRTWSCCTNDKMMRVIDEASLDPISRNAIKQAVQNAWLGENLGPVHCPSPQGIVGQREKGR